jgi:hypothetical protein
MPRPRSESPTTTTSIRLPSALYEKLDRAREGRPLGEEIRRRLQASFEGAAPTGADDKTTKMLGQVATLAKTISEHYGPWHASARTYAIFKLALEKGLPDYDPDFFDEHGMIKPRVELSDAEKDDIDDKALMAAVDAGFKNVWG